MKAFVASLFVLDFAATIFLLIWFVFTLVSPNATSHSYNERLYRVLVTTWADDESLMQIYWSKIIFSSMHRIRLIEVVLSTCNR